MESGVCRLNKYHKKRKYMYLEELRQLEQFVLLLKDVNGIANSVYPDQTCPEGRGSLILLCTVSSVRSDNKKFYIHTLCGALT